MIVRISAHVRLDLRSHDVSHIGHIVAGDAVHDTKSEIQNAKRKYGLHRQGSQIPQPLIGNIAHDQWQYQFTDCSQCRTEQIHAQGKTIFFKIRCKSAKKLAGRVLFILQCY